MDHTDDAALLDHEDAPLAVECGRDRKEEAVGDDFVDESEGNVRTRRRSEGEARRRREEDSGTKEEPIHRDAHAFDRETMVAILRRRILAH